MNTTIQMISQNTSAMKKSVGPQLLSPFRKCNQAWDSPEQQSKLSEKTMHSVGGLLLFLLLLLVCSSCSILFLLSSFAFSFCNHRCCCSAVHHRPTLLPTHLPIRCLDIRLSLVFCICKSGEGSDPEGGENSGGDAGEPDMSSLGYAEKLSYRADVGTVGMPELFDSRTEMQSKIEELAQLISASRHLVVFTGAGISTSCGIPDFRGPKGIWTLQHEGKPMPKIEIPFDQARPGITHMALYELQQAGILKFVISQNIDGLHLRSGIARSQLAELHGNCFREVCSSCEKEYFRDFEVETLGCKPTGRRCTEHNCGGKLIDTIVDWEEPLPPAELRAAEKHTKKADLVLCLGTSLQITPACNLPLKTVRAGGKMVIVNLQATPKDKSAHLLIRGKVDEIISGVMSRLHRTIPPYVHIDRIHLSYYYYWTKKKSVKWYFRISSIHGQKVALPFLKSIEVTFPGRPEFKPATFTKPPCLIRRETMRLTELDVALKLHFGDGCMCSTGEVLQTLTFEKVKPNQKKIEKVDTVGALVSLRLRAVEEGIVGLPTVISAQPFPDTSQGSTTEYGVVTKIVHHVPVVPEATKDEQAIREEQAIKIEQKAEVEIPVTTKRETPSEVAQKKAPKRRRRT